jgi:hypothetical protein
MPERSGSAAEKKTQSAPQARPDPDENLVKVFDSEQESEAMIVKGLLDSAGIENDITAVDMLQQMFPSVGGTVILVRQEDAEKARRLISESKQTAASNDQMSDETAEIDITEKPPAKA